MTFNWFFPQEVIDHKTPSRSDGVALSMEMRYRKEGAKLVINAANTLKLRYDTVATGVVFYHRFFMMQSFKEFNRWVVAAACLLLAGKVEETPKQCKVILKVMRSLLNDQQWAGFGNNPKEELLTHERILLQTIKFDLQVDHPYTFILKFAKELKGDKAEIEKLVQAAWTFVNDSLVTTLSIQWEPQAVAVAFLYLAGKLRKYDLQSKSGSKSRSWWRQFVDTLDVHDLDSICHQVLDIYHESGKDTSDDQQSDDEPASKTPQSLATPTPPSTGPNGQTPTLLLSVTQPTPSTLAPPTTWTIPVTLTSFTGQLGATAPSNTLYQQMQTALRPQATVAMTTFPNPLQALQNIQSASQLSGTLPRAPPTVPTQQIYQPPSVPVLPTQPVVPSALAPPPAGVGGVYQQQYLPTQTGYPSQVKPPQPSQQMYTMLPGQTGSVQPVTARTLQQPVVGFTGQTGQVQFPSLVPGAGTVTQASTMLSNQLSRQAFTSPYHQSPIPTAPTSTLATIRPPQLPNLQQNTTYPSFTAQNVSYLSSMGLQTGATQLPTQAPRVGGAIGSHMMSGTQPYVAQPGVRGHTPPPNKQPRWGMR